MISVIIPTRNRADFLSDALNSIFAQNFDFNNFEVIVIDNGSTDSTQDIINEYKKKFVYFSSYYIEEPGLHVGRHLGMHKSKGEFLVFTDDDIIASPTWLNSIQEAFLDPKVSLVGGNNYPLFMQVPPGWLKNLWDESSSRNFKSVSMLSIIDLGDNQGEISPFNIWGCNFSIRKKVLFEAGGFHPDSMPKELIHFRGDGETHVSQFVLESGNKAFFHPGASVFHRVTPERMTYKYFRERGFNQGISDSFSLLRNKDLIKVDSFFIKYFYSFFKACLNFGILIYLFIKNRGLFEFQLGRKEGFLFHQKAYSKSNLVMQWVHREQYF